MAGVRLCECGCGNPTNVAKYTEPRKGWVKGEPFKYLRGHSSRHKNALRLVRTHCRHGHSLPRVGMLNCPSCHRVIAKRRRDGDKSASLAYERRKAREYSLRKFGLTPDDYARMVEEQQGRCAICRQYPRVIRGSARLHVDHDHKTGAVRGLLCTLCNLALGKMDDSPERLRAGADYLERYAAHLADIRKLC